MNTATAINDAELLTAPIADHVSEQTEEDLYDALDEPQPAANESAASESAANEDPSARERLSTLPSRVVETSRQVIQAYPFATTGSALAVGIVIGVATPLLLTRAAVGMGLRALNERLRS